MKKPYENPSDNDKPSDAPSERQLPALPRGILGLIASKLGLRDLGLFAQAGTRFHGLAQPEVRSYRLRLLVMSVNNPDEEDLKKRFDDALPEFKKRLTDHPELLTYTPQLMHDDIMMQPITNLQWLLRLRAPEFHAMAIDSLQPKYINHDNPEEIKTLLRLLCATKNNDQQAIIDMCTENRDLATKPLTFAGLAGEHLEEVSLFKLCLRLNNPDLCQAVMNLQDFGKQQDQAELLFAVMRNQADAIQAAAKENPKLLLARWGEPNEGEMSVDKTCEHYSALQWLAHSWNSGRLHEVMAVLEGDDQQIALDQLDQMRDYSDWRFVDAGQAWREKRDSKTFKDWKEESEFMIKLYSGGLFEAPMLIQDAICEAGRDAAWSSKDSSRCVQQSREVDRPDWCVQLGVYCLASRGDEPGCTGATRASLRQRRRAIDHDVEFTTDVRTKCIREVLSFTPHKEVSINADKASREGPRPKQ